MILIADSGSTKTDWCLSGGAQQTLFFQTEGINPFHQTKELITKLLKEDLLPKLGNKASEIKQIHFYGSGCTAEKKGVVENALDLLFPTAECVAESDLLGAARALCGHEAGIACILGTGSNSCVFDGEKIVQNMSPLGYILGDEGSGAVLGRRLIGDCLKHQLPDELCRQFFETYRFTPADILDHVYRQPFPNRFLASVAPFLGKNKNHAEIRALLIDEFSRFFQRNILVYGRDDFDVHFVGSIAFHYQNEVKEAAQKFGLHIGKIIQSPISDLAAYHNS